ncbi:MAG: hypothetical protein CL521_05215 [Actinobacteria bacterium]|nr:hypothetical protein [Actinomycetota bacterium]|tara:strand:+ start:162 stop:467 length:306 start_codon:yes stop_codon:yes gene_type:complete
MSAVNEIMHDKQEPHGPTISLSLLVTAFLVFGTMIFAIFYYKAELSMSLTKKEAILLSTPLDKLRDYEAAELNALRYQDADRTLVKVPIDFAMQDIVDERQ